MKDAPTLPIDLLYYLYFAGVIMIGCKRWQDALHYFRAVHKADPVGRYMYSGVTMEAYKKYILVVSVAYMRVMGGWIRDYRFLGSCEISWFAPPFISRRG